MSDDHYDKLETRDPAERERDLCGQLPDLIALALSAPGWAEQLAGVDPNAVTSRAALAKLPVMRKSDFAALQKEHPPFGGLNVTAPGKVRRLLMSPGPIFEPEGDGKDHWGAARALFAAGIPRRRHRAQLVLLSSHARRLHHGVGRARARLRGHSRPAPAIPSSSSTRSRISSRPAISARRIF